MLRAIQNRNLEIIINTLFVIIILSVQSNPSASLVSCCWKIIGCVCQKFPILALLGTSTIQSAGTTVFCPSTLTVASIESGFCSRLTNACILLTSVWSNDVWNNFISSLSSVVCPIYLMALNPRIGLLIWSVVIKTGTSRWHLSSLSLMQRITTVYLLKGMSVWFPHCTLKEFGSVSNSWTGYSSICGKFSFRY